MWGIVVALFLGAMCGAFVMALMAAAGRGDDRVEEIREMLDAETRRRRDAVTKANNGIAV